MTGSERLALRWVKLTSIVSLFALLPAPSGAQRTYQAKPGDQVDIAFYTASGAEVSEVSGSRLLEPNGDIYLPYVGTVNLVGLDAAGIRDVLMQRFTAFYDDPVIEVMVKLRVNVTGTVRNPGHFFVDPSSTLLDALAVAGGAGGEIDVGTIGGAADRERVQLVRNGQLEVLDFRADRGSPETFYRPVESGDWLYVPPQARSRWRDNIQLIGSILTVIASGVFIADQIGNP